MLTYCVTWDGDTNLAGVHNFCSIIIINEPYHSVALPLGTKVGKTISGRLVETQYEHKTYQNNIQMPFKYRKC